MERAPSRLLIGGGRCQSIRAVGCDSEHDGAGLEEGRKHEGKSLYLPTRRKTMKFDSVEAAGGVRRGRGLLSDRKFYLAGGTMVLMG